MKKSNAIQLVVPVAAIASSIALGSIAGCGSDPQIEGRSSSSSSTGGESTGMGGFGGKGPGSGGAAGAGAGGGMGGSGGAAGSGGGVGGAGGGMGGAGGGMGGTGGGTADGEFRFEVPEAWPNLGYLSLFADLNADGRMDAYNSNPFAMPNNVVITFAIAQSDGTFSETHTVSVPGTSAPIEYVGDFNGDGHSDVMIYTVNARHLLMGHGNGVFDAPIIVPPTTASYLYGDLNGDKLDDAVEFNISNEVRVRLGQGNGTFVQQSKQVRPMSKGILADVDGDGDRDIIGADSGGAIYVFQNDGAGNIGPAIIADDGSQWDSVKSMAIGDLNKDGRKDLVIAADKFLDDLVVTFLGEASGQLAQYSQNLTNYPQDVDVGDIDGDGNDDVVLVSQPIGISSNDLIEVLYGDGFGGLVDRRGYWNTVASSTVSFVKDMDADGKLDIVLRGTHVAYNAGNRELKAPRLSVIMDGDDSGDTVSWVDFDGDKRPEFVMAQNNGPLEKYTFGPDLRLGAPDMSTAAGTLGNRVVRDVTGDGHPDAYVSVNGVLHLWLGAPGYTFGSEIMPLPNAWNLQWVDLNGDALLDAVYAPNKQIEIAHATAPGVFATPVNTPNTTRCYVAAPADFNGDKTVDLACVDNVALSLTLWFADAGYAYTSGQQFTWSDPMEQLYNITALDLDGDGDQDLIATVSYMVKIDVFLNDGTGNFTRTTLALDKVDTLGDFNVGDFDGDGRIELVVPKNQASTAAYRFKGDGSIEHLFDFDAPRGTRAIDVDHDGDLDLTYTRAYTNRTIVSVVRNLRF